MTNELEEWIESRPPKVREIAKAYPPTERYRMRDTGQVVVIRSYSEPEDETRPVTLRVYVLEGYNVGFTVFGIDPSDLDVIASPPVFLPESDECGCLTCRRTEGETA